MGCSRDDVERWLVHMGHVFRDVRNTENSVHVLAKYAGTGGIPIEIFVPKAQPDILVVGSKVPMINSQTARYLKYTDEEKQTFEKKIADYCYSIQAVNRNITEDGRRKIGVYMVLDKPEMISQVGLHEAIAKVSQMHEKMRRFLIKTF